MSEYPIARTVAELIAELQRLDPTAAVFTSQPPFTGVQVIRQKESGDVFVSPMPRQSKPVAAHARAGAQP